MTTNLSLQLSSSERQYILDGCRDNLRIDGRTRDDFRPYTIVTSSERSSSGSSHRREPPLVLSNGSARLFFAASGTTATHILCSVKAELSHPSPERPHEGQVQIHVDSLATSAVSSRRKTEEDNNHLNSILSALLASHLLDLQALCIVPGHYAWKLNVDLLVLNGTAGNLMDAASHVIRAALQQTLLPSVSPSAKHTMPSAGVSTSTQTSAAQMDLLLDSDIASAKPPPGIGRAPIVVTVTVCQSVDKLSLLLDATLEEQACSYCQVHLAIADTDGGEVEPTICSLRKTGEGSLPMALLPDIAALATKAVPKARAAFQLAVSTLQSPAILQEQFAIQ